MTTMIRKSREEAIALAHATAIPRPKRKPNGPDDFGDTKTIGLELKRRSYTIGAVDNDGNDAFGVYLGQHPEGYVVFLWNMLYQPTGAEVFETLEELKTEWRLD